MTKASLNQLFLSFSVASFAHVGLYAAVTETSDGPNVLIEGQSISVHLATPGNAAQDSAASAHREEKVAGQGASHAADQKEAPQKQPKQAPPPAETPERLEKPIPQPDHAQKSQITAPEDTLVVKPLSLPESPHAPASLSEPLPEKQKAAEEVQQHAASAQLSPATGIPQHQANPEDFAERPPKQTNEQTNEQATTHTNKMGDGKDAEDVEASTASAARVAGSASAAAGKQSAAPGNAAASNYAGLVMRHLSRFRRPRASGPGSAFVTFTLSDDGDVAGIEISKSSGSHKFDREAIRFTERASPFPTPPAQARRTFTVKIEGR